MLRRWMLENFKPIREVVDLPLAEITVFAGLNSSGKSSILQSILLVSQTLGNPNPDKVLILNGPIVQLGTFEGTLNDRARDRTLRIGFELSLDGAGQRLGSNRPTGGRFNLCSDQKVSLVEASAAFEAASNQGGVSGIDAVKVILSSARLTVRVLDEHGEAEQAVEAGVRPLDSEQEQAFLADVMESYRQLVPYPSGDNYVVDIEEDVPAKTMLTRLVHFLPHRFLRKFSVRDRRQEELLNLIDFVFEGRARSAEMVHLHPRIVQILTHEPSRRFMSRIQELSLRKSVAPFGGDNISDVLEWMRSASPEAGAGLVAEVREAVVSELSSDSQPRRPLGAEYGLDTVARSPIANAAEHATAYFTTMIRYLGPLRADPQAAQGFAPSSEPDDVGYRGEYAASVYDANKHQQITWWDPFECTKTHSRLDEAMDVWLRYLGVGHHVVTREAGLTGVSWMVQQSPENRERPLHAVGIGVSQVLPILVAGLMAPLGAMLLIEQPELHLHERAQARLGDFFFGLSRVGKQCIVETHSVCLVNQLRFRMVSGGPEARQATSLYFVQQDALGDARFTPVEISESGNILNWPDGFFDEGSLQEELITRESVRKRARATRRREQES